MGVDCEVNDKELPACTVYCNNYDWPTCPAGWGTRHGDRSLPVLRRVAGYFLSTKDHLVDVLAQETSPGLFGPGSTTRRRANRCPSYAWYQINNSPSDV